MTATTAVLTSQQPRMTMKPRWLQRQRIQDGTHQTSAAPTAFPTGWSQMNRGACVCVCCCLFKLLFCIMLLRSHRDHRPCHAFCRPNPSGSFGESATDAAPTRVYDATVSESCVAHTIHKNVDHVAEPSMRDCAGSLQPNLGNTIFGTYDRRAAGGLRCAVVSEEP